MKKELVKDYIEHLHNISSQSSDRQIRPNLFYSPKLDEMVFMEKNVGTRLKVSNIYLYLMEKKSCIANVKLSTMSDKERKDFVINNLHNYNVYTEVPIANMSSLKDRVNWLDESTPFINKLSILKVNQYFRKCGLAHELIKELKSESLHNGLPEIRGKMAPLDNVDMTDPTYINNCFKLSEISKDLVLQDTVDLHALVKIYQHLGFIVPEDYILDHTIKMPVAKHSIPQKDQYPASYTSYCVEPPMLLVR